MPDGIGKLNDKAARQLQADAGAGPGSGGMIAAESHEAARRDFAWSIPEHYNIGIDVCDRWAAMDPGRVAIIEAAGGGATERKTTFGQLKTLSDRLANHLKAKGLTRGDRVGVLAPQRLETALAHIAIYKCGAIAVPLFSLFGPDALRHRLSDSGARFVIADSAGCGKVDAIRDDLGDLRIVPIDEGEHGPALLAAIASCAAAFDAVDTRAEDPALIIYTSGTTGTSKGALHAHRVMLGHLPGVEMSHSGFPMPGDRIWTPADWAWIGGLLDVLLPALHHGVPVVAHRFAKFDPVAAFELIAAQRIRNLFLPPTALKMMRTVADADKRWTLDVRSVASGGESLGGELLGWGRAVFGTDINEFYGQTECNVVLSSCCAWFPPRAGAIGKPVPGHEVAVIDGAGDPVRPGVEGEIAVRRPDPVMFLGYWNRERETAAKFRGDWLLTGDVGSVDEEGYVRFHGRDDDIITTSGYRVGPAEIEDCLLRHPAVQSAGVVGIPDAERTESIAAFVVVNDGIASSDALAEELKHHVRTNLGAYLYPRRVAFLDELPMTTTAKIMRRKLREIAG